MTATKTERAAQTEQMLADLNQLIQALDRRVPRLERIGEEHIAREAADLRARAISLIQKIERRSTDG